MEVDSVVQVSSYPLGGTTIVKGSHYDCQLIQHTARSNSFSAKYSNQALCLWADVTNDWALALLSYLIFRTVDMC